MHEKLTQAQYRKLAERTMSEGFFIETQKDKNCLHAAIGIVTEVQELLKALLAPQSEARDVNIGEEIADAYWYITIFEREYELDFSFPQTRISVTKNLDLVLDLIVDSGELLDMYKKKAFYNKPISKIILKAVVESIVETLETIAVNLSLDTNALKAKNINKLMIRFPNKFTEHDANNRNLDKEYEALKQ